MVSSGMVSTALTICS